METVEYKDISFTVWDIGGWGKVIHVAFSIVDYGEYIYSHSFVGCIMSHNRLVKNGKLIYCKTNH